MADIPVIDVGALRQGVPGRPEAVAAVADACRRYGFFQVTNHPIPAADIAAVWQAAREFFALPMAAKRQLARSLGNPMGYYDRELTKNRRDRKEIFDFAHVPHPELPDDHPDNVSPIDGRNQWPDALPAFRQVMTAHFAECASLSRALLDAFADHLGVGRDVFRGACGRRHASFMRLNHYPVEDVLDASERAAAPAVGEFALSPHTDAGVLTVLLQDGNGGLQVEGEDGWMDVPPVDGALVINVGDMMQVWSNDYFRAVNHRVIPVRGAARYSVPFFFNPRYDAVCTPLVRDGDTARYLPVTWGDFRRERARGDFADYGTEIQISALRGGAEGNP